MSWNVQWRGILRYFKYVSEGGHSEKKDSPMKTIRILQVRRHTISVGKVSFYIYIFIFGPCPGRRYTLSRRYPLTNAPTYLLLAQGERALVLRHTLKPRTILKPLNFDSEIKEQKMPTN